MRIAAKGTQRAYAELHLAVFLFGFTAILGDLISLAAISLVWWRVLLTTVSFLFLIPLRRLLLTTQRADLLKFMGIGVLVALHWICFFGAVKLANPSIALVCMATTSFFTALFEPLLTRQPPKIYEIALGLLIIPGMVLIVRSADLSMHWGIAVGVMSALFAALFAILNKMLVGRLDEISVSFLELGSAWLFISFLLPWLWWLGEDSILPFQPQHWDWLYLTFLALGCTTLAYVLALRSLRYLTAFASNLTVNLEPVYGIALAWILLDDAEELAPGFYWGALVILLVVFTYPVLRRVNRLRAEN